MKIQYILFILLLSSLHVQAQNRSLKRSRLNTKNTNLERPVINSINVLLDKIPNRVELSIAMIDDKETTYLGIKRNDNNLEVIDNKEDIFEIGSISKTFTAAIFSEMLNQKVLELNTPIEDLLPLKIKISAHNNHKITLLQLTNHTSGLPRLPNNLNLIINRKNPYANYDANDLYKYLQSNITLKSIPGTKYAYSNLGVGILGHILELKTGKTYEELVEEFICTPLGLQNTVQNLSPTQRKKLVSGLNGKGKVVPNWDFDILAAAGALRSNTVDMAKYVRANWENETLFGKTHEETFKINKKSSIGMGWFQKLSDNGLVYHGHNGGTGGYRSSIFFHKDSKKGIVILSNLSALSDEQKRIDEVALLLLNKMNESVEE